MINNKKIFWCKNCLNMSTRPRISFDSRGWCNACLWMEEKSSLDFSKRELELDSEIKRIKSQNNEFDCVVPVSGGKDGSYVAHTLKEKYGLNPLTVTVRPALGLSIGDQNLSNFIDSGFDHIHISTNPKVLNALNKYGFIEKGFPYYGWLIAIHTAVIRVAINFKVPLVFYGEDGEIEYGGSTKSKNQAFYNTEYMKDIYLEGGHEKVLEKVRAVYGFSERQLSLFKFPKEEEIKNSSIKFCHWSYFEPWDSYRNYIVAKEQCGLVEKEDGNDDTFTNFAQNDQALYQLHAYLMYLKFGFGRSTQDVGIEIRRGSMTRDQGINLVSMYDNFTIPKKQIQLFLEYYNMNKKEFDDVLDKYANKSLFEKINGTWSPKFKPGEDFNL